MDFFSLCLKKEKEKKKKKKILLAGQLAYPTFKSKLVNSQTVPYHLVDVLLLHCFIPKGLRIPSNILVQVLS